MESCEEGSSDLNRNLLYWNLAVLHHLGITHLDIKSSNIMLSPSFRKPVFIDFGLSTIVKEQIGFKTLSSFRGSMNFCSDEMAECYIKKTKKKVDLYYNDLHCLEIVLKNTSFSVECEEPILTKRFNQ